MFDRNYWFDEECRETTKQGLSESVAKENHGTVEEYKSLRNVEKNVHKQNKRKWESNKLKEIECTWINNDVL